MDNAEQQLSEVQKIDLNQKVTESLVLLKKITFTTSRINELGDDLAVTRENLKTNNNFLLALLLILGFLHFFSEIQSLTQLAFILVIFMALFMSWVSIKIQINNISSEITEAKFNRNLMLQDVAKHSIYMADINADYTSNDVLAQAEKEIKELTLRRYKWG